MDSAQHESESRIQEGVVIVVRRGGRFLMIRRAPHILAGGAWCFVGGAIHDGESQPDAAAREFLEEVGGVAPARENLGVLRPDGGLRLHWWLAEHDGGVLRANPDEVSELRWCTPDEIEALPGLLESNRAFLHEVGRELV